MSKINKTNLDFLDDIKVVEKKASTSLDFLDNIKLKKAVNKTTVLKYTSKELNTTKTKVVLWNVLDNIEVIDEESSWTDESTNIIDAPEIKDPKKFIKELLESKNGWENRINSSIESIFKLSEKEIVNKIKGISVYFDVEPEDWDLYFKENNIPKEKQDQFKRYYSKLQWEKVHSLDPISSNWHDFWNISFIDDFWDEISQEAERISNLSDWETIIINIDDLNPSDWKIKFKTKKEALTYLYYHKLLFKEVWTFIEDLKQGWINIWNWIASTWNFIKEYPWEIFYTVLWYMTISTMGTLARKVNVWVIRNSSWKIWFWDFLDPAIRWEEWVHNVEWAELERREQLIKSLKEEFSGDEKKIDLIDVLEEKFLHVLDHNKDLDKELKKELREIEKEIFSVQKDIKEWTVTKKEAKDILNGLQKDKRILSWKLFRLFQGTFDAQVSYIRWNKNRYFDTFWKWFLLSTESTNKSRTEKRANFKNEIKKSLFKIRDWEIIWNNKFLQNLETYIDFSHRIPNDLEWELSEKFEIYLEKLKKSEYKLPIWITNKNYEKVIQKQILQDLKKLGFDIESNFMDKISKFKNATNYIWIDSLENQKLEDKIKAEYPWIEWEKLVQMKAFYSEIIIWDYNYELKTAVDIWSRILKWMSLDQAKEESFVIKSEIIDKIKIKSSSFALTALDLANNNFIELNENTKKSEVKLEDIELEDKFEKWFFRENFEKLKEFKLFKWENTEEIEKVIESADEKTKKSFKEYLKINWLLEKYNFFQEKREGKKIIKETLEYIKSLEDISDVEKKEIIEKLNNYKENIEKLLVWENKIVRLNSLKKVVKDLIEYNKIDTLEIKLNIPKKDWILKKSKTKFQNMYVEIVEQQRIISAVNSFDNNLQNKQEIINSIQQTTNINEIIDILINEYWEVDKVPKDFLPKDFKNEFNDNSFKETEISKEQRKQKIIDLATNNQTEFNELVQETIEKLELRAVLDWGKASEISFNWIDSILEVELDFKYNEWLLKDFANKINIEWIDYKAVELALENSSEKWKMTRKINEAWRAELKEFWDRAKKLWKEFFKEIKKHS